MAFKRHRYRLLLEIFFSIHWKSVNMLHGTGYGNLQILPVSQKVSDCMNRSSELLDQRTSSDIETALGIIDEALIISSFSEKLLEMKAEALLMVCSASIFYMTILLMTYLKMRLNGIIFV